VAWVDLTNNDIGPLGATHLADALEGKSLNRLLYDYPIEKMTLNLSSKPETRDPKAETLASEQHARDLTNNNPHPTEAELGPEPELACYHAACPLIPRHETP